MNNRCVMDSILWFHLECPKDVAAFDDPVEFKRKFRNFFAYQKATADLLLTKDDEEKRVRAEFGHVAYPEDVKEKIQLRQFPNEFKHLSPKLHRESADDFETEEETEKDIEVPKRDREWGKQIAGFEVKDISVEDSARFAS